jgi:hypothetical protein
VYYHDTIVNVRMYGCSNASDANLVIIWSRNPQSRLWSDPEKSK